jgi:flagellar biosynthesis protein FliR
MDLTPIVRLGLLLVRPAMVIQLAPGLGGKHIPPMAKIGITVLLAVGLLPSVTVPAGAGEVNLTMVIAREMAIGMALGFVVQALIAGVEFAGQMSGNQIGFSYGATIDPQKGVRNPLLATLYGMLATLAFLAVNGHHAMLRALAASYQALPIGPGHVNGSLVSSVREVLGMVFMIGIRLAAPIVVVLLIVELAVGLISRAAPTLSYQIIGYPIRIIVGLFVIAALIWTIPGVTTSLIPNVVIAATRAAAAFR